MSTVSTIVLIKLNKNTFTGYLDENPNTLYLQQFYVVK